MLSFKKIQEIIAKIVNSFNPEQIILFGSYAEGKAKEDSDLDLLVVMETDLPYHKRYPVVRRILAGYPIAFDLIIKTPAEYERTRHLVNHIVYFADKYGKKLYVRRSTRSDATVDRQS